MPRLPLDALACRCGRRFGWDLPDMDQWNAAMLGGEVTAVVCPGCQTSTESLEAEVNAALTAYHLDDQGRVRGKPKAE